MTTTQSTVATDRCPECGMRTTPAGDCATIRDALLARDFEQPTLYWKSHRLAVDAYCLQHSAYVKSAKSLAAHLCGLCIALEHDNDPDQLKALQSWLSTNPNLPKPELPTSRGNLTIADVANIDDPTAFAKAVRAWAQSAWDAYAELHPTARHWRAMATGRSKG